MNARLENPSAAEGAKIPALDGLRGMAILLVVAGHSWSAYGLSESGRPLERAGEIFFAHAELGVRIFFVLSGFLITSLLLKEWQATGRLSLRKFFVRRTLRIVPAFLVFLFTIFSLAGLGVIEISWQQALAAGTYTFNYLHTWHDGPEEGNWFLGHLWSLSLEEQFYLFWPLVLLLAGIRRSAYVAGFLILLMPVNRLLFYFLVPEQRSILAEMFHTAADPVMIGCLTALLAERSSLVRLQIGKWQAGGLWVFLLLLSPWLGRLFEGAYVITLGITLDSVATALIILSVSRPRVGERPVPARFLANPVLGYIGVLSYGWYLWQQLFLTPLNQTWAGGFPLGILASFAAACLSFYLVERPFLRLKRRFKAVHLREKPALPEGSASRSTAPAASLPASSPVRPPVFPR